jgi:prenyltransferase beta subunit
MNARHGITSRRVWLASVTASLAVLGARSRADDGAKDDPEATAREFVTPAADRAIERGLAFLAKKQGPDGALGSGGYTSNVGVCGLAGIAFLCGGSAPGRGPYGKNVDRCIEFLLTCAQDSGYLFSATGASHGPMYEHGFATLFLAEVYGMSGRTDLREKLARAVRLIVDTQNVEGGWRYHPQRNDADISVTVCQIMALRAARNAGIYVPPETVTRCIDYVKRSQNTDGGFMYQLQGGASIFPRSAAGVVALYSAGIYDGPEITKGLAYLNENLPRPNVLAKEHHYFYGHYYAVQAMWHAGGEHWRRWYPAIRDELIAKQRDDGGWTDSICNEYGAAMACIILQMPNNYLPIFQR